MSGGEFRPLSQNLESGAQYGALLGLELDEILPVMGAVEEAAAPRLGRDPDPRAPDSLSSTRQAHVRIVERGRFLSRLEIHSKREMPRMMKRKLSFFAPLWLLALSLPASASDGVLEINQACATATGCFSGDSPGFPVTIDGSAGRSYRLTSDLAVGAPNVDGLVLATSRLTLDFNGFSLVGYPLGTGTGRGVVGSGTQGAFADLTTLKNGTIRGARGLGVELTGSSGVQIENMVIDFNAGGGISLGERAQVLRCRLSTNGSSTASGIVAADRAMISENTVSDSGRYGISTGLASTIRGNSVSGSPLVGILVGTASVVAGNAVYDSATYGIDSAAGSTISGNTISASGNSGIRTGEGSMVSGNSVFANGTGGISVLKGAYVLNNAVRDNGGPGLIFTGSAAYRGNSITNNAVDQIAGAGAWDRGENFCDGPGVSSVFCP